MAFRDIYTGGACNVNDQSSQINQNPFRQFLDNLVIGRAQQQQRIQMSGVVQNAEIEQQIQQRGTQFDLMNKAWAQMQGEFQQMKFDQQIQMEQAFSQARIDHQNFIQQQQFMLQQQWRDAELQHEADQLTQEFKFQETFDNAEQQFDDEQKQKVIQDAANDMMTLMMNDPDPKFANSKFLGFLKKLKTGDLKIQGKTLLNDQGQVFDTPALLVENTAKFQDVWDNAELEHQFQEEAKQQNEMQFDNIWDQRVDEYEKLKENENDFEKILEEQYRKILQDMDNGDSNEQLSKAWQAASDIQEQELYKDINEIYHFQPNNPYLNKEFPFQISIELISKGLNNEGILALEAHLQKTNNDANAWRILGKLHQENDQDQKAVTSFLNALKYEPENLESLLALGISCTNILDELKAMQFLKQWIIKNPKFQMIPVDTNIVPDNTSIYDFTIDQIKQMNKNMINLYEHARTQIPDDADLLNALAVLNFIGRNYEMSVQHFKRALQIEPKNYSLWNKLGATLAHLNEADQAMFCYHRALDLKPNYVRVWVNLGIAYAHKGEYPEAARLYLSALNLNPNAKHIWGYLQTTFMCMQRHDLIQKIQHYNPKIFMPEFEITEISDLPIPES